MKRPTLRIERRRRQIRKKLNKLFEVYGGFPTDLFGVYLIWAERVRDFISFYDNSSEYCINSTKREIATFYSSSVRDYGEEVFQAAREMQVVSKFLGFNQEYKVVYVDLKNNPNHHFNVYEV